MDPSTNFYLFSRFLHIPSNNNGQKYLILTTLNEFYKLKYKICKTTMVKDCELHARQSYVECSLL